ncbi:MULTISPECIES: TetR family transcriptional regulator [unclassified Streptomyces]|uniref:TetR family transcriptional regulator n=1 Tax=unclassified Streptomyces TaxID=2593676 RepID=UPI00081EBB9E|nr:MULTISPECIES: TetR family transcriptional regulator [unclassified Streptomyces]MYR24837.1 TetR family transcriptional regulator [Streptomyces sp. SID4945]SCD65216.1 transcriptional regulator, TetR family [Streptomyces sp. TverLS-915]SCE68306.1 transcriptional regulator, TetR family [Streptomyces sp. LcepLS]
MPTHRRARSQEAKQQRAEDLLDAARRLATGAGGVRCLTLAAVTEAAGLHPSAIRRYFDSKEELLLELAEREWVDWREEVLRRARAATGLSPEETAEALVSGLIARPLLCDLFTHIPLSLEGEVPLERARRYKELSFTSVVTMSEALAEAGAMTAPQVADLIAATAAQTAHAWQIAHPTATLATLYEQNPELSHPAREFEARVRRLLRATARGLAYPGEAPPVP